MKTCNTILIFGGSLGAKQINEAITSLIEDGLLEGDKVLHQVGKSNINSHVKMNSSVKYHQVEYINDMQKAYASADIIICRAGASTITELEVIGKPTIIIPYPQASDNHQYLNAREYKKKSEAYTEIIDHNLEKSKLAEEILTAIKEIRKTTHNAKACLLVDEESASYKIYKEMKYA
jgi:UDP-N-acetylglucosamine--N-acetylmuramyl-(pentapeptide) pyrophosphoryl-undecaprenol N-acetylglucosamine transferase